MLFIRNIKAPGILIIILLLLISGGYVKGHGAQSDDSIKFEAAKVNFRKGIHFFNKMQYLAAVEFFRKAISEYPDYYTAREYLARSYKLAGFIDEALMKWEILAKYMSNPVPIINKINNLRFRQIQIPLTYDSYEFVLSDEYISSHLGRFRFSRPVDIAIDRERNTYITSFNSGKLVKLDSNGAGASIYTTGRDSRLYGVDCHKKRIVVSDFKCDSVSILDSDFRIIKTFGASGQEEGNFYGPEGVCFDGDGNIYVVDSGNNRVQKFDKDGNYILKFGEIGKYEGQLKNPTDVVVFNDEIYVTDTENIRVACFDYSGNFIKNISMKGLDKPRGINVFNNTLMISDERKGLLFFRPDNKEVFWFHSWDNKKSSFSKLISAVTDRADFLYCLDYNYEKVFVFSPLTSRFTNLDVEITMVDIKQYPVVAFYLNINHRSGKPVYNFQRDNFRVIEDSAKISGLSIDYLRNKDPSVSIAMCVDRSYRNKGYHFDIPWISEFILKKMRRNDSIKVINFHNDYWIGNDFDWSRRRSLRALRKSEYGSGKNLGRTLYNAISDLLPRLNRRAVILITDGSVDNNSFQKYTPKVIIEYARSQYIPVYIIVFKEKNPVLKQIAGETGGGIYKATELNKLRGIYNTIKSLEEYRYILVYSTYRAPSIKGWWSDVQIEVSHKGQKGVEWGGYFVP